MMIKRTIIGMAAAILGGGALLAATPLVGDLVPAFTGTDQDGRTWTLGTFAGKKAVLLYFYPKDGTPGCTKQACGLRDEMVIINQSGVEVVGVSMDDAESHRNFIAAQKLNFTLLADPAGKIADAFGARMPVKPMARRISFLIGKDGKIMHITDNPSADVHLDEMRKAIGKLKEK